MLEQDVRKCFNFRLDLLQARSAGSLTTTEPTSLPSRATGIAAAAAVTATAASTSATAAAVTTTAASTSATAAAFAAAAASASTTAAASATAAATTSLGIFCRLATAASGPAWTGRGQGFNIGKLILGDFQLFLHGIDSKQGGSTRSKLSETTSTALLSFQT